jgi:DNA-binding response OmpR family regulator
MKEPRRVLLIDDDASLGALLKDYLKKFDMRLTVATAPQEGLVALRHSPPQLVLLEVMLPGQDGFEVLREIRKTSRVPVIMLTARGEMADKVLGLESGADDYLAKPFEPRELVARIQSVLRRLVPAPKAQGILVSGLLRADPSTRTASLGGKDLSLTPTEYEILTFFMRNPGEVVNRDRIMEYLKGIECEAFNRSIDIAVSRLRKKIKDPSDKPQYFKTVWGEGYLFIGKVKPLEA